MKKVTWIFIWVMLKEPEKSAMLDYFLEDRDPPPGVIPRSEITIIFSTILKTWILSNSNISINNFAKYLKFHKK